jgi:hypothetical protein
MAYRLICNISLINSLEGYLRAPPVAGPLPPLSLQLHKVIFESVHIFRYARLTKCGYAGMQKIRVAPLIYIRASPQTHFSAMKFFTQCTSAELKSCGVEEMHKPRSYQLMSCKSSRLNKCVIEHLQK